LSKQNGYKDYEFSRRKVTLNYLESAVKQFTFEANKLVPISEHFEKLKPDDKRRYLDAVLYLADWAEQMHKSAENMDEQIEQPAMTEI